MRTFPATFGIAKSVRSWQSVLGQRPPLRPLTEALAVGVLVFLAAAIVSNLAPTPFNNYSFLGDAIAHGRLSVDSAAPQLSVVPFNGHKYVVEPPWPAVLMLPLCLFAGDNANQTILSVILLATGTAACWLIVRRLALPLGICVLLVLVFLFATPYFFGGSRGDVWQIAEVSADTFLLLAILEVGSRNQPIVVASCAFASAMSRFPLLSLAIAYAAVAWVLFGRSYAVRYTAPLSAGLLIYAAYNVARWGTPFDLGYRLYETAITHQHQAMFGLSYFQNDFHYLAAAPPNHVSSFPWIMPDGLGIGMIFTGLVFLTAVFARPTRSTLYLWAATLLAIAPSLLYYDSGDGQYYNRHFLDCAPFLWVLLVRAVQTRFAPYVIGLGIINVATGIVWALTFKF